MRENILYHWNKTMQGRSYKRWNIFCYRNKSDLRKQPKIKLQKINYNSIHLFFSAGIGRTGTYIALDALYREGERTGKINVPMYIRTMRKDRMNMIQGDVGFCFYFDLFKRVAFLHLKSVRETNKCSSYMYEKIPVFKSLCYTFIWILIFLIA